MPAIFSFGFILLIILLILIFKSICIVPQASAYIVEELGKYKTTLSAGLNFI